MAYVSTIISGAASLGVLIGLISGIFFLVLTALKWVTRVRESLYEEELRRQKRFLINNSYLVSAETSDFLDSKKVDGFGTTQNGSNLREKNEHSCQSNVETTVQWKEREADENVADKEDPSADTIRVRELIEKMVETMIEGPLDGTTVGQLSTHSAWKNALEIDSTDLTQSKLKRLIKRIVTEAMALPNIKEVSRPPRTSKATVSEDFKGKSYEDILATAILNKVIENSQYKKYNEVVNGSPKPRSRKKKIRRNDDDVKSDDDWSDTSRSDQLSLTIEEYIEEVTTALEASEDERSELSDFETTSNRRIPFPESGRTVIDAGTDDENSDLEEPNAATELITSSSCWEENWLFQKKRLRSTPNAHHPVPVPMLVPNPSEDFRALVGGVDADDLSDMSDCVDSVLEDLITAEEKPSVQLVNIEPEELIPSVREEENSGKIQTYLTDEAFSEDKQEGIFNTKLSNTKDNNYDVALVPVEECSSVTQSMGEECDKEMPENVDESLGSGTLPDILSQKDRESSIIDFSHQYESLSSQTSSERVSQNSPIPESEEGTTRCPLAEREREKWLNPVPLSENPYSLKSIEKREQRKKNEYFKIGTYTGESIDFPDDISSDEFSRKDTEKFRFSRDYYINASKHPAGMPSFKRLPEDSSQKFRDTTETLPEKQNESIVQEMEGKKNNEVISRRVINKSEFCLPSVKELAKHFTQDDSKELKNRNQSLVTKLETKHKVENVLISESPTKESEVDYSTTPVSEIILHLQQAAEAPARENHHRDSIYNHIQPPTQMEICRKVDSKIIVENYMDNAKKSEKVESVRFNGKEVHSLTARSISKEFREGLKNNSYQKHYSRIDRSSSGESDHGDIVCSRIKTSPTPSVDLKNMKKFWEKIITANSNSTKEK